MSASHLLRIIHRTHYRYVRPVLFEPHRLVIRPREGHDLRVEELHLRIEPKAEVNWAWDVFGNSIATVYFHEPSAELKFELDVVVRRYFPVGDPPAKQRSSSPYPLDYDLMEQAILRGYLTPVFEAETGAMNDWLGQLRSPSEFESTEAFALDLAGVIHRRIQYERREQKGVQSPEATLAVRSGSCRDVATLMMETLRHLGVATRFASGYLDCSATRAARGSTHAWCEVYFPHLGWRGYDPTTGRRCEYQHIVTGTSHHPRGVMPVSGRYFGPAGAFKSLQVTVEFSTPEDSGGLAPTR